MAHDGSVIIDIDFEAQKGEFDKELNKLNNAAEKGADSVKDLEKSTKDAKSGFGVLDVAIGNLISNGISALISKTGELLGSFFSLAEETREYREDMGKLEAAFTTSGFSADAAKKSYQDMNAILGESDRSVEAVNHLAKLCATEEELADWTNICTGVLATFGDSLPIEGLTEAANETAKVGQVTGPLADALNWAGVSEDAFNASLAACNTEQERAALITETLNGLYSEAADAYREVNGGVMDARAAQEEYNAVLAEIGEVSEPVMTALTRIKTGLLEELVPALGVAGEGFAGLLNGTEGAAEKLADGISSAIETALNKALEMAPAALSVGVNIILSLVSGILSGMPDLVSAVLEMAGTIMSTAADALPQIALLVAGIVPQIVQAFVGAQPQLMEAATQFLLAIVEAVPAIIDELLEALPNIISTIVNFCADNFSLIFNAAFALFYAIIDAIPMIVDALAGNLPQIVLAITQGLVRAVPQLLSAALTLLGAVVTGVIQTIPKVAGAVLNLGTTIISTLQKGIATVLNIGKSIVQGIWNGISSSLTWIKNKITGWVGNVMNFLKSLFGIASPSKWARDVIGKNISAGVAEGIEDGLTTVENSLDSIQQIIQAYNNRRLSEQEKNAAALERSEKDLWENLTDIERKYAETVEEIYTSLTDDIQKVWDDYYTEIDNRTKDILKQFSLFEAFEKGDFVSSGSLINNIRTQITALEEYGNALDALRERGLDEELIHTLEDMGVDALPEIEALVHMNDEQLKQYEELWQERNALARELAVEELEEMREESIEKIDELISTAEDSLEEAEKTLKTESKKAGEAITDGLIEGVNAGRSALVSAIKATVNAAVRAAKETLGIASPSKVMQEEVGKWMPRGIESGFVNEMPEVEKAVTASLSDLNAKIQEAAAAGQPGAGMAAAPDFTTISTDGMSSTLRALTAEMQHMAAQNAGPHTTILEMDGREFGRTTYRKNNQEVQRIGLKLGGATA